MPEIDWRAKKRNMDRRVNTYSHPGVSQVIYKGEWKKRTNRYPNSDNPNIFLIFLILAIVIGGLSFLLSIIWK